MLFKIEFVSIRPGFVRTAIKGKIDATPVYRPRPLEDQEAIKMLVYVHVVLK